MPTVWPFIRSGRRLAAIGAVAALASLSALQGCDASKDLLEVSDPDLILPEDLNSAEGAEGLRLGALSRLRDMAGGGGGAGESPWLYSGLLVDEYGSSSTFTQNDETDQRNVLVNNSLVTAHFRDYHRTRTAAQQAINSLRLWKPADSTSAAEMYFVRGFAEMSLAQDFCNGIALSSAATESMEFGLPLAVAEVLARAVATFDTGLAFLPSSITGTQATLVRNALHVAKARAYMSLGRDSLQAAAALVSGIQTSFAYNTTFAVGTGDNAVWSFTTSNGRYTVGDSVEGNARNILVRNAIPFLSARDPRVPARYVTRTVGTRVDTVPGQDGQTYARVQDRYVRSDPMAVVNGIDARLIEAEARLQAGNITGFLQILNTLRTGPTAVSGSRTVSNMAGLTDPGASQTREDLLFRERAFWTYGRGQRLNDLRRLVRQYERAPGATFPVGPYYKGGEYGPDMNFPIPQAELNNPNASACTNRGA